MVWWSTNIFLKGKCTFSATCSFFRRYQNFPVTCFAVQFIFFRPHQHFPATCSAVVFSDSTKFFHSRVLQFLFFRQHKFSNHVFCSSFFPTAQIFQPRVLQFLFPTAQIFQRRVASFKLADISTTCDVVYCSFHQQQS